VVCEVVVVVQAWCVCVCVVQRKGVCVCGQVGTSSCRQWCVRQKVVRVQAGGQRAVAQKRVRGNGNSSKWQNAGT